MSVSLVMFGSMVWQIRGIPIGGVMSSAAVAVVQRNWCGWISNRSTGSWVSISGDGPFEVAYRGRGM